MLEGGRPLGEAGKPRPCPGLSRAMAGGCSLLVLPLCTIPGCCCSALAEKNLPGPSFAILVTLEIRSLGIRGRENGKLLGSESKIPWGSRKSAREWGRGKAQLHQHPANPLAGPTSVTAGRSRGMVRVFCPKKTGNNELLNKSPAVVVWRGLAPGGLWMLHRKQILGDNRMEHFPKDLRTNPPKQKCG